MQANETDHKKKIALIIVNNEIILNALKKVVENLGYEVRQDIQSSKDADFGFIGAYFAFFGIVKQIRAVNSSLPLVLVVSTDHESDARPDLLQYFYDIITFNNHNEMDIKQKMTQWFTEASGKLLVKEGLG